MSYVDALKAVSADPTLQLSPYSELSVLAGRVGLETIVGTTLESISSSTISSGVQTLVMTIGLQAASAALSAFSAIPFVGAVTSVIGLIIGQEMSAEQRKQADLARQAAECTAWASAFKPIASGAFAEMLPADLLAPYLSSDGAPELPKGEVGYMPEIGQALWLFGFGYALPNRSALMSESEYQLVRELANKKLNELTPWNIWLQPPGMPGPSDLRREQFKTIAMAIGESRRVADEGSVRAIQGVLRPPSDGGIGLWPVLLDILWNARDDATTAWADFMATTSYGFTGDHGLMFDRVDVPECGRVHPGAIRQAAEMRRGWGLTISPLYVQYQARAAELRALVEREMRRLMAPMAGFKIGVGHPMRTRSSVALAGLGLAVAAAAYPAALGGAAKAAVDAGERLIARVRS